MKGTIEKASPYLLRLGKRSPRESRKKVFFGKRKKRNLIVTASPLSLLASNIRLFFVLFETCAPLCMYTPTQNSFKKVCFSAIKKNTVFRELSILDPRLPLSPLTKNDNNTLTKTGALDGQSAEK